MRRELLPHKKNREERHNCLLSIKKRNDETDRRKGQFEIHKIFIYYLHVANEKFPIVLQSYKLITA